MTRTGGPSVVITEGYEWRSRGPELKGGSLNDSHTKGDGAETVDGNSTEV